MHTMSPFLVVSCSAERYACRQSPPTLFFNEVVPMSTNDVSWEDRPNLAWLGFVILLAAVFGLFLSSQLVAVWGAQSFCRPSSLNAYCRSDDVMFWVGSAAFVGVCAGALAYAVCRDLRQAGRLPTGLPSGLDVFNLAGGTAAVVALPIVAMTARTGAFEKSLLCGTIAAVWIIVHFVLLAMKPVERRISRAYLETP